MVLPLANLSYDEQLKVASRSTLIDIDRVRHILDQAESCWTSMRSNRQFDTVG
jgi:hypothetical protein